MDSQIQRKLIYHPIGGFVQQSVRCIIPWILILQIGVHEHWKKMESHHRPCSSAHWTRKALLFCPSHAVEIHSGTVSWESDKRWTIVKFIWRIRKLYSTNESLTYSGSYSLVFEQNTQCWRPASRQSDDWATGYCQPLLRWFVTLTID
jgi:hypothetical protein